MGGACEKGNVHTRLWWRDMREGVHLEDPGVDGRVVLNGCSRSGMGGMDWIDLAQDRDRWRAVVNAVMNFRVP
jgi:hypothetical protein